MLRLRRDAIGHHILRRRRRPSSWRFRVFVATAVATTSICKSLELFGNRSREFGVSCSSAVGNKIDAAEICVAVREAYATLKAAAIERIDGYLKEHPSGHGEQADRQAWALASYKLTYDTERFGSYLAVNWSLVDRELFGDQPYDEEDNEETEQNWKNALEHDEVPVLRRFSFAWLLDREIFALLERLDS